MLEMFIVVLAQVCLTSADVYARSKVKAIARLHHWLGRYAATRGAGLILRLFALFSLPTGSAATLFSMSAISMSSIVSSKQGDALTAREWWAIGLIITAVVIRSVA